MTPGRMLVFADMQIQELEKKLEAAKEAEAKAAAFDWLMTKIQEAYDHSGWVEIGDLSLSAQTVWGQRDECLVKAEIQWKDHRDEPLNLLAAINKAKGES